MDILVDLDGTLVDPKPGLIGSIQYALGRLGCPVPPAEQLLWMIGPPLRISFPRLLGSNERTEEAIGYYRENYFKGAMYDAIVYNGIHCALDTLREAGHRLFVATAKPHSYARPILEHFGLARHFAGIHGPELDGTRDHKHELIAHILTEHRSRAEAALMIGDREHDVVAAARNGMRTIGVTWGYGSRDELVTAGAAVLCAAPPDLAQVAGQLFQQRAEALTVQLSHPG